MRLKKVNSILFGIFTISVYAYGNINFVHNLNVFIELAWGLLSLFLLISAGYLMNDLCDLKYDQQPSDTEFSLSDPDFRRQVKRIILLFTMIGFGIALAINLWFALIVLIDCFFLALYNLYSKKFPYFKALFITMLVVTIYPLSLALTHGGIASIRRNSLAIFPIWLFFSVLGYELLCDILDMKGDTQQGGQTLPILIGARKTLSIVRYLVWLAIPLAFLPFVLGMCGGIYFYGLLGVTFILLINTFRDPGNFSKGLLFYIRMVTLMALLDIII